MVGSQVVLRQGWRSPAALIIIARRLGLYLLLIVGVLVMLTPFAYMVGISFTADAYVLQTPPTFIPAQPTFDN